MIREICEGDVTTAEEIVWSYKKISAVMKYKNMNCSKLVELSIIFSRSLILHVIIAEDCRPNVKTSCKILKSKLKKS